ncbi:uncharacterized protein KY384_007476 [Bacidia gigantensis]|uniref:uncharacterized protein n=1 Tax=Bacidia gigantensis TaxID=2732470 RepID=UPI001D046B5E|nr:uncharacterized protein KY384_007476 [Bacidia gigantensis]KAG8527324.1 hypothetical protein KY384_007476 [Bacidia gigantensis]
MALAYPEGECFFTRKALDSSAADGYKASDPKNFYSHMMIEYVWNHWADSVSVGRRNHPRAEYKNVTGVGWNTRFGAWSELPISYGPRPDDIKRRGSHKLCTNGNVFRDRDNGGGDQLLGYVRAIYLPVAHSVNKDHEDLCSFVQVNFALDRKIDMWIEDAECFYEFPTTSTFGLGIWADRTLGVDVSSLIELLCLPRQLRKNHCYALKLIKLVNSGSISHVDLKFNISDEHDKSWVDVAKGNFGLDLTWLPAEKTLWAENFVKNTLNLAIGFIPVAGPFCQIMFTVAWTGIAEDGPAAWKAYKDMCPGWDLTEHMIQELARTSNETRKFLPTGWQALKLSTNKDVVENVEVKTKPVDRKMDKSLQFRQEEKVYLNSYSWRK